MNEMSAVALERTVHGVFGKLGVPLRHRDVRCAGLAQGCLGLPGPGREPQALTLAPWAQDEKARQLCGDSRFEQLIL